MSVALPVPRTAAGVAGLAALLTEPGRAVLASDFDGTLAPIVARPEDARPAAGAIDALARLAAVVGRLVIVTGRPVDSVREIAGLTGRPELAGVTVLGHYGLERWDVGADTVDRPDPDPGLDVVRQELPALLAGLPGAVIEDKQHSVAVHTRSASDPAAAFAALLPPLRDLAARAGLEAVEGRYVVELRPGGLDKGSTLLAFAAEARASCVAFMGDDLGDLPAFAAVDELRRGGTPGLTVASASDEVAEVSAAADVVVDGPAGIVAFLGAVADALERS
ncbi:MAG: trehalose 6-phosphate phosphatase [Frankiaceae bacterium]|nr:trehalose 6-phosphate phosphatase [Frankiaceae bacterium]